MYVFECFFFLIPHTVLTREGERSSSQAALFEPLTVEEAVADGTCELVQFGPGGVHQVRAGLAEHGGLHPPAGPHRRGHQQHCGETQHPPNRKHRFLLSAGHDGDDTGEDDDV